MIVLWVYLVGIPLLVVPFSRAVLRLDKTEGKKPDNEDYFMAVCMGMIAAMGWPLALIGLWVMSALRNEDKDG